MKPITPTLIFILALFAATFSRAEPNEAFNNALLSLQHDWASVNYTLKGDTQNDAYLQLITRAEALVSAYPERAESHIWFGIVESSYAGVKGGLGALGHAKAAKRSFEEAIQIDGAALEGSAYTSLGILLHKVPGWPIAFGNDNHAREFLVKALSFNPKGIDPNYFYAEFLYDDGEYEKAREHAMLALTAAARSARPLADRYRRAEAQALLAKVDNKLNKKKT